MSKKSSIDPSHFEFDPWIAGYKSEFTFVKAEISSDFVKSFTLKFADLPPEINNAYNLHIFLNPEPTRWALDTLKYELSKSQLELGEDVEKKEAEIKEKILEVKRRYDEASQEIGINTFSVITLEYKKIYSGWQIKFATSMQGLNDLYKILSVDEVKVMIAALEVPKVEE